MQRPMGPAMEQGPYVCNSTNPGRRVDALSLVANASDAGASPVVSCPPR
jgi:hypothetical protein